MAIVQLATFDRSGTDWFEKTSPNSGHQVTDAAIPIALFFETIARTRPVWERAAFTVRGLSAPRSEAVDNLEVGPDDVVEWSTYGTDVRGPELGGIGDAFEQAFAARGSERDEFVERLIKGASAESVAKAAIEQFRHRGNAERLMLAAALLERYGHAALLPLRNMGRGRLPESEYFVDTLVNLAEDPSLFEPMIELLRIWSEHPEKSVRLRLIDVSDALRPPLMKRLLNRLVDDQDEEVAEAAREHQQSRA